ncbi:DUF664 domain-containing protein [uncultured Algibacter sp.]|uniref:mycothiol transferase n=1 Tax=uncultured Algibacter sp. TaxID=298659 RepID=UPI003216E5CA
MKKSIFLILVLIICLNIKAQEVKTVSRDWTSFRQQLDIVSGKEKKFKVVASVKVETEDESAWAGVWARVDNKDSENGFFDNMRDRPIKSNVWKKYTIEGSFDSNAKQLNFGGICSSNGKFYFDNFKLFLENDKGDYAVVEIDNSSFEKEVIDGVIPRWSQGISKGEIVKVKEFKIKSNTDSVEGRLSIMIEGSGIKPNITTIGAEGASPQIGAMISMLEDLKSRVERQVMNMSQYEIDYLHDKKANRIGALIMHLAAAEAYYQVFTFQGRSFNEEEKKKWSMALNLGEDARKKFKNHDVQYYLDIYNEVRAKTIEELKKRNDKWFEEIQPSYGLSNHYCWFHVMEHQSSHLGQILFLQKRIPKEPKLSVPQKKMD